MSKNSLNQIVLHSAGSKPQKFFIPQTSFFFKVKMNDLELPPFFVKWLLNHSFCLNKLASTPAYS
ncbi:UNVERIFIED_ORG: hypothetical protein C7432_0673 [Pantoea allii]|jgi:hypothetical protein|nr:hypothetical protein SAMN03097714_1101 [Pantoea ananatis]